LLESRRCFLRRPPPPAPRFPYTTLFRSDQAGVQHGAKQVVFGGMDGPVSDKTPDFAKALDVDHARDGEVMLAYLMNGRDLPFLKDRKSTRLNSSHVKISYAVFCLKKKKS